VSLPDALHDVPHRPADEPAGSPDLLVDPGGVRPASPPPPSPPVQPPAAAGGGGTPVRTVLLTVVLATVVATSASLGAVALTDRGEAETPATSAADVTGDTEGGVVAPADDAVDTGGPGTTADAAGLTVQQIAAQVGPSVAAVEVQGAAGSGRGSAVVLSTDGLLVTNDHVVRGATSAVVVLADGTRREATVVGTDPATDLAVLRIDADGLPAATFAEVAPEVGDPAVAIGSPFGLDGSVSAGIVSALDRTLATAGSQLHGLIQTDAAINPGNSGGALVDARGHVMGINTAIISGSGTNGGVGFAVPAAIVRDVADQLVATGEARRAVLGIGGRDIAPEVAAAYGLEASGVLVVEVAPGSAAAAAGLLAGDVITSLDGVAVTSMAELATLVRDHAPGETVVVEVVRDGEALELTVTLGGS
jgi:S1-C subfamily serine protease